MDCSLVFAREHFQQTKMTSNFEYLLRLFEACIANDVTAIEYLYAIGFNRNCSALSDMIPANNQLLTQLIDAMTVFRYNTARKQVAMPLLTSDEFIVSALGSPAIMINSLLRAKDIPGMPILLNDARNENTRRVFDDFKASPVYDSRRALFDRLHDADEFLSTKKGIVLNYDASDHKDSKKMIRLLFAVLTFNGTSDTSRHLYSIMFGHI